MNAGPKSGNWFSRISSWSGLPLTAGSVLAITICLGSLTLGFMTHDRLLREERMMTTNHLGFVRTHLEAALNSRLLLGKGLVSYVAVHPEISRSEFQAFAEKLVGSDPVIRNTTLIKNSVIVYAYPPSGNEKAIGVDLLKIPGQRAAFQKAIDTKKTVVDGPIDLVQGGRGLISRIPIFVKSQRGPASEYYWGQASIVIVQDALLAEAKLRDGENGLSYALSRRNDAGMTQGVFWGSEAIYRRGPVTLDVIFPNGSWQLAAIPSGGWGAMDDTSKSIVLFGTLLGLVAGYLVYRILGASRIIQKLESILPICANCKKVRDDQGYWEQVESYLLTASNIKCSHGICPECLEKLYGGEAWFKKHE
jgi:sensor domain CHASE-containing protein